MKNPFHNTSSLNHRLSTDMCQQIFFRAARSAPHDSIDPDGMLPNLRALARRHGPDVYILHPAYIEEIFQNITLAVYQEIQHLFYTPLHRSHCIISRILDALARQAQADLLAPEAVWAICEYLRADRDAQFAPGMEQLTTRWYLEIAEPNVMIQSEGKTIPNPLYVMVVSDTPERVLAFRRNDQTTPFDTVVLQTLYDALTDQRRPEPRASSGLKWYIPAHLSTSMTLSENLHATCAALHISIDTVSSAPAIITDLHGSWTRSLAERTLSAELFEHVFDNYLEKRHGYGPRKSRDDANYAYRHLDGYNRDPALVLPALRNLLPVHHSTINNDGTVSIAGRHYYDSLLTYWCGRSVDVRLSLHDPTFVYIYLDDEILCQAQETVYAAE